ncbi:MAG TPA: DUF2156 domain-containing protein [Gemmatimonadaceae bacterium]|nr:DUF2156 domain-containing protein [Gemmatimonadaceae bacterium]
MSGATDATRLPADVLRARALVLRHGWNATAYQLLNPGFRLWFSERADAVVGYVAHAGVHVVGGAPVCAPERLAAVAAEFEAMGRRGGRRTCYFGAGWRLEAVLREVPSSSTVLLGAQPVWEPADFDAVMHGHASLRGQLHRARNKGVTVEEWPAARADGDPALRRVLHEWLATRGLPPLHFLVEPHTLGRLLDRRVFVAMLEGAAVGFVVCAPVPAREGWLVEQFVRGRDAPLGCTELMIAEAMRALAADGARYATLGLAPLSRRAPVASLPHPVWLRLTLRWVRGHGTRFYNFEGLDAFKAKLRPAAWEPIYAIAREPRFSARTLWAIAGAFSGGSPLSLLGRALTRAAGQELRWAAER